MEMGGRVCEGVTEGREGMEALILLGVMRAVLSTGRRALPGRCSSRKKLLLCVKGQGAPQLPLGSQNSRDNRGTIPWAMAQHVWKQPYVREGRFACRFAR